LTIKNAEGQTGVFSLDTHEVRWLDFKMLNRGNGIYLLIEKDGKKGLVDLDYEVVLPPVYDEIQIDRVKGEPIIMRYKNDNEVGLLDSTSNLIAGGDYDRLELDERNPDIIHFRKGNFWGVMSKEGKEILPPTYGRTRTTDDGGAISFSRYDEYGLATLEGELIIEGSSTEPMLDYITGGPFQIRKKRHIEFRSPEGKLLKEVPFVEKSHYKGYVIAVGGTAPNSERTKNAGVYKPDGTLITSLDVDRFAFFDRNGIIIYEYGRKWGMMNLDGKVILEPSMDNLKPAGEHLEKIAGGPRYKFKRETSSGLMDENGKVIFEVDYPVMSNFDENGHVTYYTGGGSHEKIDHLGNVIEPALHKRNKNMADLTDVIKLWQDENGDKTLTNAQGKKLSKQKFRFLYYAKEMDAILFSYKPSGSSAGMVSGVMNTDIEILYETEREMYPTESTKTFFHVLEAGECERIQVRKRGFVNAQGKEVLKPTNGNITYIPEQELFQVQIGRQQGYIDLEGQLIGITQEDIDECKCCSKY